MWIELPIQVFHKIAKEVKDITAKKMELVPGSNPAKKKKKSYLF